MGCHVDPYQRRRRLCAGVYWASGHWNRFKSPTTSSTSKSFSSDPHLTTRPPTGPPTSLFSPPPSFLLLECPHNRFRESREHPENLCAKDVGRLFVLGGGIALWMPGIWKSSAAISRASPESRVHRERLAGIRRISRLPARSQRATAVRDVEHRDENRGNLWIGCRLGSRVGPATPLVEPRPGPAPYDVTEFRCLGRAESHRPKSNWWKPR